MDERKFLEDCTKGDITYLEKTEKILFTRLWGYIIGENWQAVGQVVGTLKALSIV